MSPEDFAALWQLNDQATAALNQLDPDLQQTVMEGFKPREGTRNTNDLFMSYTKSILTATAFNDKQPEMMKVEEFVEKWGLSPESHEVISNLPSKTQNLCLNTFHPRGEIQNINNIFGAFVRSLTRGSGKGKGKGKGKEKDQKDSGATTIKVPLTFGGRSKTPAHLGGRTSLGAPIGGAQHPTHGGWSSSLPLPQPVVEFILERGLSDTSGRLLSSLIAHHPETADAIIHEFNPYDASRDPDEIFTSFWRQKVTGALMTAFQLSEENIATFKSLNSYPLLQAQIVEEFKPREARDVSKLFGSFMASRLKAVQTYGTLISKEEAKSQQLTQKPANNVPKKRSLDAISGFISQWNLSPENEYMLRSCLSEAQQQVVMAGFAPKRETRDVNGLFSKFALSIQVRTSE